jgi:hypothetical protein
MTRARRAGRWTAAWLVAAGLTTTVVLAQDITGTVTGTVMDETNQVLPGATVTLTSEQTQSARTTTTDGSGDFRFVSVYPGAYSVKIELAGFRSLERKNNILSASARLSLGAVRLAVGSHNELVTVEASGSKVNTEDSQHAGLLTSNQIDQIQTKGREVMNFLRLIPGVSYFDDVDAMGADFGTLVPNIGGQRDSWNHITVDGVIGNEIGGSNRMSQAINLDAIEEVKVLLNNYRPEYGRGGGGYIQIVSKGGGKDLAGNLYYYGRRESLNANRFFDNRVGRERGQYRYNTFGFNLGGPVQIPGLLRQKDDKKLFFFYSLEAPLSKNPGISRDFRLPTERERNGDFSQSGIRIFDPATGQEFPGGIIPASRISAQGRTILNIFPVPNGLQNNSANANHGFRDDNVNNPRLNQILRLDWKPSPRDSLFFSAKDWYSDQQGQEITVGPSRWGGWLNTHYKNTDRTFTASHTRIFGANLINEANVGIRRQTEEFFPLSDADYDKIRRDKVGWTVGQFHPELNPEGIIPKFLFGAAVGVGPDGGRNREPGIWYDSRLVSGGSGQAHSFRDNLTLTRPSHTFKAGVYVEHLYNTEGKSGSWMGEYDFRSAASNPLDACKGAPGSANQTTTTACAFANAALGVFSQYRESDAFQDLQGHSWLAEWYLQDTWKASRKLTVDYGVRFHWATPWYDTNRGTSVFVPGLYDPGKAPRLYYPAKNAAGQNVAIDRATGQTVAASLSGTFVPNSGDIYNGLVRSGDPGVKRGYQNNQGIHPEPRIGLAYDLFGNSKTALHLSGGLYHFGRRGVGIINDITGNPPVINNPVVESGTFDTLLSLSGAANRPSATRSIEPDAKTPSAYNWALGIQHELGWGAVIDVTYTGSVNRHLPQRTWINRGVDGAQLLDLHPENRDPITNRALADVFLRPITQYQDIYETQNFGTQNYNALQVQINRRYIKGLQLGLAYTYSKSLGISNSDDGTIIRERDIRQFFYAPNTHSQTHNFVINYTWDLPKASRLADHAVVRLLFDNWQLSGENVLASGNWEGIQLARINGANPEQYFGTVADGGRDNLFRPVMIGKPGLPSGRRKAVTDATQGDERWFDVNAFTGPSSRTDYGNTPRTVFREPGINNWNLSVFKNFVLGGRRKAQFRWEIYNLLNHTQFDALNREFHWDTATQRQTNALFGTVTGARPARIMQGSIRFTF